MTHQHPQDRAGSCRDCDHVALKFCGWNPLTPRSVPTDRNGSCCCVLYVFTHAGLFEGLLMRHLTNF